MTNARPFDQGDVWVYYFDDPARPALTAMTLMEDGSNLPQNVAWVLKGRIELGPMNRPWVDTLELAIEQNGFYLDIGVDDPLDDPDVQKGTRILIDRCSSS